MLSPIQRETFLGNAEVLQVFDITKVGKVAGCRVTEGTVLGVACGSASSATASWCWNWACCKTLKRFKDEVNEVTAGQEWHGLPGLPGRPSRPTPSRLQPRRGEAELAAPGELRPLASAAVDANRGRYKGVWKSGCLAQSLR